METQIFARQLTEARRAAGMTQAQLAEAMHMSRQGISHWENGRALPDAETLKQLSQVLNYDFITSGALTAEAPSGEPAQSEGGRLWWQQPVVWLSAAVAVLALMLVAAVALLLGKDAPAPAGQGSPVAVGAPVGEQAVVRIIPAQNPLTPAQDPVLGPSPWWIWHLLLQETAGVDFTIEKMTYTYQHRNGQSNVVEYGADYVAAGNPLGTNVLRAGVNLNFSGAEPLWDLDFIAVRVDGTDAKGNVLSFELVMDCQLPQDGESAVAELHVEAQADPVAAQVMPDMGPDPVWLVTFDIFESAGVPVTLQKVTVIAEGPHGWEMTAGPEEIRANFGTNEIPGHSALPWTVGNGVCDLTAFTLKVEAVDANGNVLTAQDSVRLTQE